MNCQLCYVSANCVPTPGAADCSKTNIIAYASSNSVLIYDFQYGSGGKIIDTLVKHSDTVRSVRWIRGDLSQKAQDLISGGSDGRLVFWTLKEGNYTPLVINHYKNDRQEKEIISAVDGYCKGNKVIICCLTLKVCEIWEREGNEDFVLRSSFKGTSISLRLTYWQQKQQFILACATSEGKINVISQEPNTGSWFICHTLLGHENWVNGLDFTADKNGNLLLASASQDTTIRLWRLSSLEILSEGSDQCILEKGHFNVYLESVINGHEGWIYSVNWNPVKMQLLSASLDKSIIIWEIDKDTGLWLEKARLGEVGGNTLGFYGGFFDSHGHQVIGYSYHGAFHIWKESDGQWDPAVQLGGHFKGVVDMSWDPDGECLFSVSQDQTARIHAPWSVDNKEVTLHELARPQVHGYDLSSIAVMSKYQYVSGAEEKVIRLFKAPVNFKENFYRICKNAEYNSDNEKASYIPRGASVPSLGLSNKAVFKEDNEEDSRPLHNKNPYPEESRFSAQCLEKPPTEETLLENTLWPEEQKLYGHCYEIYCLAASPDGKYLASASRATIPLHAEIFIWDTESWKILQRLSAHSLTVVQMQFSPNSRHLLSVSRDRRWALFTNKDGLFELADTSDKSRVHTRIIWTCAWSHDSEHFGTGSRDGIVAFWTRQKETMDDSESGNSNWKPHSPPLKFTGESVTALAMAPAHVNAAYLCAIGFEKGEIKLYKVFLNAGEESYDLLLHLSAREAHHLAIKRLAFRPKFGIAGTSEGSNKNILQLASCSLDTSVRIYNLTI